MIDLHVGIMPFTRQKITLPRTKLIYNFVRHPSKPPIDHRHNGRTSIRCCSARSTENSSPSKLLLTLKTLPFLRQHRHLINQLTPPTSNHLPIRQRDKAPDFNFTYPTAVTDTIITFYRHILSTTRLDSSFGNNFAVDCTPTDASDRNILPCPVVVLIESFRRKGVMPSGGT